MKNWLRTGFAALARRVLRVSSLLRIRSLETLIDGQGKALESVTCPFTKARIEMARHVSRRELALARADYTATLPVGVRRTWRMA